MCSHPRLTEVDKITFVEYDAEGQQGNVTGAFNWKKYICDNCNSLVTVLSAVVEKSKGEQK